MHVLGWQIRKAGVPASLVPPWSTTQPWAAHFRTCFMLLWPVLGRQQMLRTPHADADRPSLERPPVLVRILTQLPE